MTGPVFCHAQSGQHEGRIRKLLKSPLIFMDFAMENFLDNKPARGAI